MLEYRHMPVQLFGAAPGLNQGDDPKIVSDGLLRLQNAVIERRGAISKRTGTKPLTGTYAGRSLGVLRDRPVLYGHDARDADLKIFDGSTATAGSFDPIGEAQVMDVDVDGFDAVTSGADTLGPSVAQVGDVLAFARYNALSVYNRHTGLLVASAVTDGFTIAVACGIYLVVFDHTGYRTVNTSTGAIGSRTSYPSYAPYSGTPAIDVAVIDSTTIMVVYAYSDGATDWKVVVGKWASGVWSYQIDTESLPIYRVAIARWTSALACVVWNQVNPDTTEDYFAAGWDTTLTKSVSQAAVFSLDNTENITKIAPVPTSSTACRIYATVLDTDLDRDLDGIIYNTFTNTAGTGSAGTPAMWCYSAGIHSHAFAASATRHYICVWYRGFPRADLVSQSPAQRHLLILNEQAQICGQVLMGDHCQSTAWATAELLLPCAAGQVQAVSSTEFMFGAVRGIGIMDASGEFDRALAVSVRASIATPNVRPLQLGDHLLIPNGQPWITDGRRVAEAGFVTYPEGVTVAQSGSGSGLTIGAVYGYRFTYAHAGDSFGALKRSAPSEIVSITAEDDGGGLTAKDAVFTIPTCHFSRLTDILIEVWRTEGDGPLYRRIGFVANDPAAATVSYTDDDADSAMSDNRPLYTDSGELEAQPCPSHRIAALHQRRYFCALRSDETRLRFSKELQDGVQPEFNELLEVAVQQRGGGVVALASFAERLIVFEETATHAVFGDGPTPSGLGGYQPPALLNPAVGCVCAKSIVETPDGLLFQSAKGIYLLTRSLEFVPVGQPVRYTLDNVTIKAACLLAERDTVVFITSAAALAFNYRYKLWSTWPNFSAGGEAYDAVVAGGLIYQVTGDGAVLVEDTTSYLDDADGVQLVIDTGWMSPAGVRGRWRWREMQILGECLAAHTVQVDLMYDHVPAIVDALEFDASAHPVIDEDDQYSPTLDPTTYRDRAYAIKVQGSQLKGTAVRAVISDKSPSNTAAFTLTSLSFLAAVFGLPHSLGSDAAAASGE